MRRDIASLLALLYDWHNGLRLQRQSADVTFWTAVTESASTVAIMGAGTGRIAVELARRGHQVAAIDLDLARLRRMPTIAGLYPVCADYRGASLAPVFHHVIFPYSALQLVPIGGATAALGAAYSAISCSGTVWVDVSDSFRTRPPHDWRCVLEGNCPELGVAVQEWQKCEHFEDHLELGVRFQVGGQIVAQTVERWHYHDAGALADAITKAGLVLLETRRGYGADGGSPRHVYRMSRAS